MAFADYRGNRQYISAGNLAANERACLFLMDYVRQRQLDYRLIKELWALAAIGSPSDLPTSGMTTVATGSDRSGTRTGSSTIVA
jgi:predicted pyridoxine 5'-phosphate oxidase superfamily flavin-nucleotide-binding protein